jgi:VIT1/CCC1 family predicted Fe2+/Mn2+ transporter
VAPFLFLAGPDAVLVSALVSAAALFALGAGITLFTGRGVLRSGVRQLLIGVGAARLTYELGRLLPAVGLGASL